MFVLIRVIYQELIPGMKGLKMEFNLEKVLKGEEKLSTEAEKIHELIWDCVEPFIREDCKSLGNALRMVAYTIDYGYKNELLSDKQQWKRN